jgi:hypothetical protein
LLDLRYQRFESLAIAGGDGQGRAPDESRRLAGSGGLVDPAPVGFTQPKREDDLLFPISWFPLRSDTMALAL